MFLVTGGGGFIGSHVVEHLAGKGLGVRVLDDFSTGRESNLAHLEGKYELVRGTLLDLDTVKRAAEGCEAIIHLGAIPSVPRSIADPVATNNANVNGTLNALIAARDLKVRRIAMASSSSVYGDSPTLPKIETMPANPKSIYAASKLIGEHYARVFNSVFGLSVVCLRFFNVFGPRQDPNSEYAAVIPKFIKLIGRGISPEVHGDGLQTRDFTYVDNVAQAVVLAATVPEVPPALVCNIACGDRVSLLDLVGMINRILGADVKPVFAESRAGDVKHSLADISAAKSALGYDPLVGLEEGIGKTIEYMRKYGE